MGGHVSDRVVVPFGIHLLCLPLDAFETALREGATIGPATPDFTAPAVSLEKVTRLMTAEVAANALSVEPQWLLRQAREGRIEHVRIGKFVRFRADVIIEQGTRLGRTSAACAHTTTSGSTRKRV
jgi:hypothetical protein